MPLIIANINKRYMYNYSFYKNIIDGIIGLLNKENGGIK